MKRWIGLALLSALILTSCRRQAPESEIATTKIETIKVSTRDVMLTIKYPATMRGRQDIAILPQIEGKIIRVLVTEGQAVRAGQPLFVIDQTSYRAALITARANMHAAQAHVDNARLTLQSKLQLQHQKVVSAFTVAQARYALRSAQAELEQARAEVINASNNLSYTVVKSPSSGVVGTLSYKIGALVSSSMTEPMTYVSDNAEMIAYFSLNENQITSILRKYGSKEAALKEIPEVRWQMNDGSLYKFKGRVVTISGLLDAQTGTVSVRAAFNNPSGLLLSGANGNVMMPIILHHAVVIPQTAVSELQDKMLVKRVIGGREKLQQIQVYPENDGKNYVVTSGLKAGDIIKKN